MCGIVGVITTCKNGLTTDQQDMFNMLLQIDTLRGKDSTGVFGIENNGNVHIAKDVGNGYSFTNTPEYAALAAKMWQRGFAMVGHNRAATRGSITDKNAHPFNVDDKLVLVHNGSYFGDHTHLANTQVDSEAIAITICNGGQGKIEESLSQVNSAYALVWYDVVSKKLNIIRNEHRPLFWAQADDAWYFASEAEMLNFAAARCKVKFKDAPRAFPEHMLSSWEVGTTNLTNTKLDCEYYTSTKGSAAVYVPFPGAKPATAGATKTTGKGTSTVTTSGGIASAFSWMRKVMVSQFNTLTKGFENGTILTVRVMDYVDANEGKCVVFAETTCQEKLPVAFTVDAKVVETVMEMEVTSPKFSVEVAGRKWTRDPNDPSNKPADQFVGVMSIIGVNPCLQLN